jgi:hypothetical protein
MERPNRWIGPWISVCLEFHRGFSYNSTVDFGRLTEVA